jgi:proteasome lid subunit RPN8/RPN11
METALITFPASRKMIKQSGLCPVETGGVLVGIPQPLVVLDAGEPGPHAVHDAAMFTSDPETDTACLEESRQKYGESVMLLGWWHKHPAGLTTPSPGDCRQAQQLASEFNDGQPVLIGIVNRNPRGSRYKTTLHLYAVSNDGTVPEHPWKLAGRCNAALKAALKQAAARPGTRDLDYWRDKDFQFYLNPVGRARIREEIAECRDRGWNVSTSRTPKDQVLTMRLSDGIYAVKIILPPEYPLNPPTIMSVDDTYLHSSILLAQWSSLYRLVDLAVETFACMRSSDCTSGTSNHMALQAAASRRERHHDE